MTPATSRPADPFGAGAATAPTGLVAGWLLERPSAAGTATPRRPSRRAPLWLGAVARQVRRWERHAAAKLWTPPHPLGEARLLHDLDAVERRQFLHHFRAFVPAELWTERWAAERHLEVLLPAWPVRRWSEVRGLHLFLGAAGAGKTTLLFSVARQLVGVDQRVTAIALLCPDAARRAAFTSFAAASGVQAVFADSAAELQRQIEAHRTSHTLLLDTPCLLTPGDAVGAALRHPVLRHPRTALHLCLSMQHSRRVHARVLQHARALRFDCLAISHLDLTLGGGPLLGVQLQGPWPVSFAHASSNVAVPPFPGSSHALRTGWERAWN